MTEGREFRIFNYTYLWVQHSSHS